MADTKVEKEIETTNPVDQEDTSDLSSNQGSLTGSSSTDDDGISFPSSITASSDQIQQVKMTLSKQPSNGIHVLKADELNPSNGTAQFNPHVDTVAAQPKSQIEEITFDPNGSYYMANACCELVHYRTAAVLVGICELVLISAWAVFIGWYYNHAGGIVSIGSQVAISSQVIIAAGFLAVIIVMLAGVLAERPMLLWPHMIVQIVGIALGIKFTIVAVVAMCAGTSLAESIFSFLCGEDNLPVIEKWLGPVWPFCLAVVFDFGAALGIWFYIVVKGCYEYLMDKAFFEKQPNNMHNVSLKKVNLDAKKPS